jgi:dihydroflavonol-4-reductase
MGKMVLVTGGTGYVAGWCLVHLLQRGYDVRTTVRTRSKETAVRNAVAAGGESGDRVKFFVADLTKDDGWDASVEGCDYVLHVASPLGLGNVRDPDTLITTAREGTVRVLRAATKAGVSRVVITSSTAAATPPPQAGPYSSDESVWTDRTATTSMPIGSRKCWPSGRHGSSSRAIRARRR